MRLLRKLDWGGDTIIEVMIVLAILGLAIAMSYATANRGLQQSRNAEEHSEALGYLQSQVEEIRQAVTTPLDQDTATSVFSPVPAGADSFCLSADSTGHIVFNPLASATGDNYWVTPAQSSYPAACINNGNSLYQVSVVYDDTNKIFTATAKWQGLGDLGTQQEQITYRITPAPGSPAAAAAGFTDTGSGGSFDDGTYVQPPPPPATNYYWSIAGDGYDCTYAAPANFGGTCASDADSHDTCPPDASESGMSDDNANGCNPTSNSPSPGGNALYARRGVDPTYDFANGTFNSSELNSVTGGSATLVIDYEQYTGAGTQAPPGYAFEIDATVAGGTTVDTFLPASASSQEVAVPVTVPADVSVNSNIELAWVNNELPFVSGDPDLQINCVALYSGSLPTSGSLGCMNSASLASATSSPEWFADGGAVTSCSSANWCILTSQPNSGNYTGTAGYQCQPSDGSAVYTDWADVPLTYNVSNLPAKSSYNLTLAYLNCPYITPPNPPYPPGTSPYAYNVNIFVNGSSTAIASANLPADASNPLAVLYDTIPLNFGISKTINTITVEWTNDYYDGTYDANFQLNSLGLQ